MNQVSDSKGGRLMIFRDSEWTSVCNNKFGPNEAMVACRVMGFDTGKIFGTKGSTEACE